MSSHPFFSHYVISEKNGSCERIEKQAKFSSHKVDFCSRLQVNQLVSNFTGAPLQIVLVTENHVRDIINLPQKSCALDPVPTTILTQCLDTLIPVITDIINHFLFYGLCLSLFQHATATPLLQKCNLEPNDIRTTAHSPTFLSYPRFQRNSSFVSCYNISPHNYSLLESFQSD